MANFCRWERDKARHNIIGQWGDMHHTLRFYGQHQHQFLRLYIFLAKLTKIPLIGGLVRRIANIYGQRGHQGYLLTIAEAEQIIDASGHVALGPCSCRQVFHRCDNPIMSEIVVDIGVEVFSQIGVNGFREVSKDEAKEVLRQCHQKRLTHSIMRCQQHFYAICNCCSCCCVPTRLKQNYGIEYALARNKKVVEDFQKL